MYEQEDMTVAQVGRAPAMPYGAAGEHKEFPGTLSFGTEALTTVLVKFVRHAIGSWQQVIVIDGHGGNFEALAAATVLMQFGGWSMTVPEGGAVRLCRRTRSKAGILFER